MCRNFIADIVSDLISGQVDELLKVLIAFFDLKEQQNAVAQQYKTNPKVGNNVNSKTKYTEKIGDLKKKNEHGDIEICNSAKTKADSLCEFFRVCIPYLEFRELSEDLIRTMGNRYKLIQHHSHYDLRKFNFTNWVIPI